MTIFEPGTIIDGYRLIRIIGSGGFGNVWLCISETLQQYFALKIIRSHEAGYDDRELAAVRKFKQLTPGNRVSHIMPIEHVGSINAYLFYIMPLADGETEDPASLDWTPLTLGKKIQHQRENAKWFTSETIIALLTPIVQAVETINNAGLIHRDIKPDNILFLQGQPVLSDISLLREDAELVTEIGTPGYRSPSWYVESGGKPDMFGLAATLYTMLTGNAPDKIGRASFRWPPQGESSLSESERAKWLRFHQIIFRATAEKPTERFLTFANFAEALSGNTPALQQKPRAILRPILAILAVLVLLVIGISVWKSSSHPEPTIAQTTGSTTAAQAAWKEFDEIYTKAESSLKNYEEQWKHMEAHITSTIENITRPPMPGTIQLVSSIGFLAEIKELQPAIQEAKTFGKKIQDAFNEISENMDKSYDKAVSLETSPEGWKKAHEKESAKTEIYRKFTYFISGSIQNDPIKKWAQPLNEELRGIKSVEDEMHSRMLEEAASWRTKDRQDIERLRENMHYKEKVNNINEISDIVSDLYKPFL